MKKRYIISTSNLTSNDQIKKFATALNTSELGWWHWLPSTWLVIDYNGRVSAASLANALRITFPSAWFVVFEYKPSNDWMAYGPTGSGNIETDMIAWIREHWVNPNESLSDFFA